MTQEWLRKRRGGRGASATCWVVTALAGAGWGQAVPRSASVPAQQHATVQQQVTVRAVDTTIEPDPAAQAYRREDLLDANAARPGVPLSVPGFPAETSAGGIKAPQYFAPGVAGDHGEPIAQYIAVGGLLIPNNLTANAHGNGYADPNLLIGPTLDGVVVDSAAFNALYGDHAINLAVTYSLRSRLSPFLQVSTDGRDGEVAAGWGAKRRWVAVETLFGNGWLERLEHRQQVKMTGLQEWTPGRHRVTLLGVGYEGFSHIPGLIPLDRAVPGETVDERQRDTTHTEMAALVDEWTPSDRTTVRVGGYGRRYGLDLRSNFGDGLIRQSERRWIVGGDGTWTRRLSGGPAWLGEVVLLAGADVRRDAPRELSLARVVDAEGAPDVPGNAANDGVPARFAAVTMNNLTIVSSSPFAAATARPARWAQVYAGVRHDTVCFNNQDVVGPTNSFDACPGMTSPKMNLTLGRLERDSGVAGLLPQVGVSFATAYHANDPRIGTGTGGTGSLLIGAREWQVVAAKEVARNTELRVTVARVANAGELAKIDPDTGLQKDLGRAVNRYLTVALHGRTSRVFWQTSWSEADARDREAGTPIPEAPRMIADATATVTQLPMGITAQGEFEYVKAKPLGDGFNGVPLREVRLAVRRGFRDGQLTVGVLGQLVQGFSGQTTEVIGLPGEAQAVERVVGVPGSSYASVALTWRVR